MTPDNSRPSLDTRFAEAMGAALGPEFPDHVALAVSGGGDSMAMLHLAAGWARVWGPKLWVVTVNHGLRPEAANEAALVAEECKVLGLPHATLTWSWDGEGNLQERAREARLQLIDRWRMGIEVVLMAHTLDDQAETFLMRLRRGSGVDGLSAMAAKSYVTPHETIAKTELSANEVTQDTSPPLPTRRVAGVPAFSRGFHLVRPCLDMRRDELRHYARMLKIPFADDPSNDDPAFERVRTRQAIQTLDLDVGRLAQTSRAQSRARSALRARAEEVASRIATSVDGCWRVDRVALANVEEETQLRLLAGAILDVSSTTRRPRLSALEDSLDRALAGGGSTLQGAEVFTQGDHIWVVREFAAVAETASTGSFWDTRWELSGPRPGEVRALGESGVPQLATRPEHLPFKALLSQPALFDGPTLLACPAAKLGQMHASPSRGPWGIGRPSPFAH